MGLLFQLVLPIAFVVFCWVLHRRFRDDPDYDRNAVLERTFAVLSLPLSDGGQLPGQAVRVVKRPAVPSGASYLLFSAAGQQEGYCEEFWYCAGPGNHYWLAIANCERHWWRWRVQWVVRPLTAERMRNALMDDPAALQAAFGDVQPNRLMA